METEILNWLKNFAEEHNKEISWNALNILWNYIENDTKNMQ